MSLFEGCDPEALYQLLREAPNSLRTYKEENSLPVKVTCAAPCLF